VTCHNARREVRPSTINALINGHVYQYAATVAPIQYIEVDCSQYPAMIHRVEATTTKLVDMDTRLSNFPPNYNSTH